MKSIQEQIHLPWRVAVEVVLQGIKIRLGRSLVTLSGVALGTAFLMSLLAAATFRDSVREERLVRKNLERMMNFLMVETGPLEGRRVATQSLGPANEAETRLLAEIGRRTPLTQFQAGEKPDALLLIGEPGTNGGTISPLDAETLLVYTRATQAEVVTHIRPVQLDRKKTEEELAQVALAERKAHARKVWIVCIALLVTVIGICNSLLMSVTERFREIGTMKCLGARSSFIRRLFFIESGLLGSVGSLGGAVGGLLFAFVLYGFTYGFPLLLDALAPGALALQFLLSTATGLILAVIAAIYPAHQAASMVPAAALRSNV